MTNQHPITPSPELVQQWVSEFYPPGRTTEVENYVATQAARWGSDQELEACCQALRGPGTRMRCMEAKQTIDQLRAARRPKPPSLKEQALAALNVIEDRMLGPTTEEKLIRKALEQLDD